MNTLIRLKSLILVMIPVFFSMAVFSQSVSGYSFTEVKRNPATSVKNQYRTSTCWSFSGISFFESELLRQNKGEFDLSDMFIVRTIYLEKALKYARMQGKINFAGGGAYNDVQMAWNKFGIVPDEFYPGLNYGEEMHNHTELDAVLRAYMDQIILIPGGKLSTAWLGGLEGILDSYLGKIPSTFSYKGTNYSPLSFSKELGINMDNYVLLTSFTHHPFYKPFVLEVPDNWNWGEVYNIKLKELTDVIDNAINQGFTVAWASDYSERGFSWINGVAIVPDEDVKSDTKEKKVDFSKPGKEVNVTQEMRQKAFDNLSTTDDHGMHITGIAKDQDGNKYYIVKNSWGTDISPYNGYLYASEQYVKMKTTNILVHKDAIPAELRKKLNL